MSLPRSLMLLAGGCWRVWKRCPYVFTVADIWPESAVQLGMLRNRTLIRLAEWLEWSTYRRAGRCRSVTAGIRQALIARGLPEKHIFLLPNGVDTEKFQPRSQAQARAELGLGLVLRCCMPGRSGWHMGWTRCWTRPSKLGNGRYSPGAGW